MTNKEKYQRLKDESIKFNDGALFTRVIDVLRSDEFIGISKEIDRVKGAYALASNFNQTRRYAKRQAAWQKK